MTGQLDSEMLEATGQKIDKLRELYSLTKKLSPELENTGLLLQTLEDRQKVIDSIALLNKKITSLEEQFSNNAAPEAQDTLDKQREEIKKLLQEIIAVDTACRDQIGSEMKVLTKQLRAVQNAKNTAAAYMKHRSRTGGLFLDKRK